MKIILRVASFSWIILSLLYLKDENYVQASIYAVGIVLASGMAEILDNLTQSKQ